MCINLFVTKSCHINFLANVFWRHDFNRPELLLFLTVSQCNWDGTQVPFYFILNVLFFELCDGIVSCCYETRCVLCMNMSPGVGAWLLLPVTKQPQQQDVSRSWQMFEKSMFESQPLTISLPLNIMFGQSGAKMRWIMEWLVQSFANIEAHATPW